jgi:signal transduction histidine kinase
MSSTPLARDQFVALVCHELRSPLNGIKSWTHVLETQVQGCDDPTIVRAIAGIMTGVEQQVRLIDDLLDVTRALSGDLGLAQGAMALAPAIAEAVQGLRDVATEKGVDLVLDPAPVDAQVHGEPVRIQQIVSSLVGNAIKFTPEGGTVRVSGAIAGDMARIEVRDSGAGIPQQEMSLGLALAQRLAELHGGRVTSESEGVGRGAIFRVYLPLRR